MRLQPGERIGPYEVAALIGQGGMGEVYRALDPRLHRSVAIKTLQAGTGGTHIRRARFEREALAISQLNHPNICAIYDVGAVDGTTYLVMEYVEGETLADRLRRGPVEWPVAVKWAAQIAAALDAAHSRGITHRDLKPANVMVNGEAVKLLDFGLAKFDNTESSGVLAADITLSLTAEQSVVGTLNYMAPEQLEGRDIDSRTDLFAFGAVLYEMLTGRKAFNGPSGSAVATAILASQPEPVSALVPHAPQGLERIVQRSLAKDPGYRWQTARDLINELQWIVEHPSGRWFAPLSRRQRPWLAALGAVAALATMSIVSRSLLRGASPASASTVHLSFVRPPGLELTNTGRPVLTIAPDGRTVVFNANNQLWVRRLDTAEAVPLDGIHRTGVTTPFFSPDGRWIAFFTVESRELKKIPIEGGAPITICPAPSGAPNFGASWTQGGDILFATADGVFTVPATGGTAQKIIEPQDGETLYGPELLPDRDHVLLTSTRVVGPDRWELAQIVAHSLSSRTRTLVVEQGADARYVASGHIVYAVGTTLFAIPFNPRTLQPRATPTTVLSGVRRAPVPAINTAAAFFAVSNDGALAYVPNDEGIFVNVTIDLSGRVTPLPEQGLRAIRVSPDGSHILATHGDSLWVHSLTDREAPRRLTSSEDFGANAVWTPDGRHITFRDRKGSRPAIVERTLDAGSDRTLVEADGVPIGWSGDGTILYYIARNQLWSLSEGSQPRPLSPIDAPYASLSPDRRWVAFHTRERGTMVPMLQSIDDPAIHYEIAPGGHAPLWSPDGRKIFYVNDETNSLMSIDVRTTPTVSFGAPVMLVPQIMHGWALDQRGYDVAPDGTRIYAQVPDFKNTRPRQIEVVLNWFDELTRLAPAR